MSRMTHFDPTPVSNTHVKSWWPSRRRVILWPTWLFRFTVRGVVPATFPSISTSALPHRPAGRTPGSRDILSHEATFLSPGCHPGSLV